MAYNKLKNITTSLNTSDVFDNTINITSGTYTLPSSYSIGAQGSSGTSGWDLYSTSAITGSVYTTDATVKLGTQGIDVKEGGDIKIGNASLKDFMDKVEQRLALLTPNPELEKEWEELKELGNKYRELEKHIVDKMKTWDILKREDNSSK